MRRIVYLTLCLLVGMAMHSPLQAAEGSNAVVVQMTDSSVVAFEFSKNPKITFADDVLTITADSATSFVFGDIAKIYFSNIVPTSVKSVKTTTKIYFDGSTVTIMGADDGKVGVYSVGGVRQPVPPHIVDGGVSFSVSSLPPGVYIIKTSIQTFKISKR